MLALQPTLGQTLPAPACETAPPTSQFEAMLAEVSAVISPVWPLNDYVAVNPYSGLSARSFMDARSYLRVFSDCELLMSIEHYAAEYNSGRFSLEDIESAIHELASSGISYVLSAEQIAENLTAIGIVHTSAEQPTATPNQDRPIRTIAEILSTRIGIDWNEAIIEEVSKHCAAHYDQGQATWGSPYSNLTLYQAWRKTAVHDCNIEILGLTSFRKYVSGLPQTPETAIVHLLDQLGVPQPLWSTFLLCQAFSVSGWSAWAKYQDSCGQGKNDLVCLLAIRLAYDVALADANLLSVKWSTYVELSPSSFKVPRADLEGDACVRLILLRASEIAYRNSLLSSLTFSEVRPSYNQDRRIAQMVFCIDVRSERMRRHLESLSGDIETFGFAGFFGMAFEYVRLGQRSGNLQLPVLLKPQFKVSECVHERNLSNEAVVADNLQHARSWRALWKIFQASSVSCFSFVETTGLLFGGKLLSRALGFIRKVNKMIVGVIPITRHSTLGPTLRGLIQQGLTTSRQADLAENMLRGLGITKNFAKLVVFCGHACQTDNNPLAAGMDCGACGGHSGEPNARFAAMLLNQPNIRDALAERGIAIPSDTYFIGAVHNTTTDEIEFFDVDSLPSCHKTEFEALVAYCGKASSKTLDERIPLLASSSREELQNRSQDWSEVRPEWGLAGNASMIVARRAVTRNSNLDGRSFLHSYDYTRDAEGKVLENIMTAPMIVAHWINMQYYSSTVDHRHFGSGNKTVHNIVGGFGILSGNGGDLMTGLPWQSLHTGKQFQHLPLRLQVVIDAPREMIDRVIAKHQLVSDLLRGGWLHLIAIDQQVFYRLDLDALWEPLQVDPVVRPSGVAK